MITKKTITGESFSYLYLKINYHSRIIVLDEGLNLV